MNPVDESILKFILKNKVLTLATCDGTTPYCCSIFYLFDLQRGCFYFMSSKETKHIQHAIKQSSVAGTIVSGNTNTTNIRGIQFTGRFYQLEDSELGDAKKGYLKKFPMALLFNSVIWAIETESIKMTDNTLGFGKKILWSRERIEQTT